MSLFNNMVKKIIRKLVYDVLRLVYYVLRLEDYRLYSVYRAFRSYTMIPADAYVSNLNIALRASDIPGAIVECGTWKGRMIAGMALILGENRDHYLFDSFEGLLPVEETDGQEARLWQENTKSSGYHNNCTASMSDAKLAMDLSRAKNVTILKGWFQDTVENLNFPSGIAIL